MFSRYSSLLTQWPLTYEVAVGSSPGHVGVLYDRNMAFSLSCFMAGWPHLNFTLHFFMVYWPYSVFTLSNHFTFTMSYLSAD